MRKKILLKEEQLKKLLETRINEVSNEEVVRELESIDCTGEDLKTLMTKKLSKFGFQVVKILYLGKNLSHKFRPPPSLLQYNIGNPQDIASIT